MGRGLGVGGLRGGGEGKGYLDRGGGTFGLAWVGFGGWLSFGEGMVG